MILLPVVLGLTFQGSCNIFSLLTYEVLPIKTKHWHLLNFHKSLSPLPVTLSHLSLDKLPCKAVLLSQSSMPQFPAFHQRGKEISAFLYPRHIQAQLI